MIESAVEVAGVAREFARETEARRALAPEVLAALGESGLLRAGVPKELGGPELPPEAILRSAEAVARGDASAGWCVSIAATSSLLAAYLPDEGAREVFGPPDVVAAGVWAPRGTAVSAAGGVVVSGRWAFCSGIPHADWLFAGCVLDGATLKVVALPKAEIEVLDTWHTGGLRGTGSHDCVAREVFVPEHRVLSVLDGPLHDGALYRFPVFGFFALSVAVAALGNARGAIDDLLELAVRKKSLGSSKSLAERTRTQAVVAQAEASLRAARLLVFDAVDHAWREPEDRTAARVGLRLAATHATRTSAEVVAAVYDLGAGSAIYEDSPLQRRFRDAHTATAHFQVDPASYELPGRLLLGLPTRTEQL
ncbi:acyl-CoA dehydrogenase family protein [Umezawaea sp.]|uniref:acyl-CoA dehydrogenase family protein n=1 Tax=Umezawaea sp. TaxID=1955258 RepID=UPI002ED5CADC